MELWGVNIKGLIKTDNNWTLIIDENDERNISMDDVINQISNVTIKDENGNERVTFDDKSGRGDR